MLNCRWNLLHNKYTDDDKKLNKKENTIKVYDFIAFLLITLLNIKICEIFSMKIIVISSNTTCQVEGFPGEE